jgi:hypothetical protein
LFLFHISSESRRAAFNILMKKAFGTLSVREEGLPSELFEIIFTKNKESDMSQFK